MTPNDPTTPLDDGSFADLMQPIGELETGAKLAVAYSGGPDSLSLLLLACRWARTRGYPVLAVTVDHQLRPGSSEEAAEAGRIALSLGAEHRIVTWHAPSKPQANIQALARQARYDLLADTCREAGVGILLAAHHLDDQAETFLLRLGRGSGVDGLAAMAPIRYIAPAVRLFRPLLSVPKSRLAATLEDAGLRGLEDPSNLNPKFDRVRIRSAMALLSDVGLTPERLAATASHMARARTVLESMAFDFLQTHARLDTFGVATCARAPLAAQPAEIALRVLGASIKTVTGAPYRPREKRLSALLELLAGPQPSASRTLGGCLIRIRSKDIVFIREPAAADKAAPLRQGTGLGFWDHRFRADLAQLDPFAEIRALGLDGLATLREEKRPLPSRPAAALASAPALWRLGDTPQLLINESQVFSPLVASTENWRL